MPIQIAEKKGAIRKYQILESERFSSTRDILNRIGSNNVYYGNQNPCSLDISPNKGDLYYNLENNVIYAYSPISLIEDNINLNRLEFCYTGNTNYKSNNKYCSDIYYTPTSVIVNNEELTLYFDDTVSWNVDIPPAPGDIYKTNDAEPNTSEWEVIAENIGVDGYGSITLQRISGTTFPLRFSFYNCEPRWYLQRVSGSGDENLRFTRFTFGPDLLNSTGVEVTVQNPGDYALWGFNWVNYVPLDFNEKSNVRFKSIKVNLLDLKEEALGLSGLKLQYANGGLFSVTNRAYLDPFNWIDLLSFDTLSNTDEDQLVNLSSITSCATLGGVFRIINTNIDSATPIKVLLKELTVSYDDSECCWQPITKEKYYKRFTFGSETKVPGAEHTFNIPNDAEEGLKYAGYYQVDVYATVKEYQIDTVTRAMTSVANELQIKKYTSPTWNIIDTSGNFIGTGPDPAYKWYNNSVQGSIIVHVDDENCVDRKLSIKILTPNATVSEISGYVHVEYLGSHAEGDLCTS